MEIQIEKETLLLDSFVPFLQVGQLGFLTALGQTDCLTASRVFHCKCSSKQGRSRITIYHLALEINIAFLCPTLPVKTLSKAHPVSRRNRQEERQNICNHRFKPLQLTFWHKLHKQNIFNPSQDPYSFVTLKYQTWSSGSDYLNQIQEWMAFLGYNSLGTVPWVQFLSVRRLTD